MKVVVIYYSKTGNTKSIAEVIAKRSKAKIQPINLVEKKGRGTDKERQKETELFELALNECKYVDLLFIGTSTSFKKAQSKIRRFVKLVETKRIALFCTYTKDIGITLTELEDILNERNIVVIGIQEFGGLKTGQYKELVNEEKKKYIEKAERFAESCLKTVESK